jgi:signal transduction histidine kinase
MGSGGVLPGPDPPVRTETVHLSERTRVTRLFLAGGTVIRKEPLGPSGEGRVRHEVAMLERLRGVTGVAQLDELLEIARGIHPAILAERGLAPALKTLARRSPIPVDLKVKVKERLPEPVEVSAYYIIAEALTNAAKHARASTVSVRIEVAGEGLLLAVRDDGTGGADFNRGTGLAGLKDRVEALGGRIVLDSPRGAGTSLRVELPLTTSGSGQ